MRVQQDIGRAKDKTALPRAEATTATLVRLIHGDCIQEMQKLPEESVDVVVTSPPYNLGIRYGTFDDNAPREEYLGWTLQWCEQLKRVLKPNGSFFLNIGSSPSNPMLPHEVVLALRGMFVLQNTFHWVKSITVDTRSGEELSVGHFKPMNSKRFVTDCHEYIFHLTQDGRVPLDRLAIGVAYADKSNVARWRHTDGHDKRCRGNNWFIPYETIHSVSEQRPHPATFPPQLAEQCIRVHGACEQSTVLDPFLGIGSSLVAAKRCGVAKFIGIELDEEYLSIARRLSAARN
jgi:site-specific DNA-methyltransferase (adenine-specific)